MHHILQNEHIPALLPSDKTTAGTLTSETQHTNRCHRTGAASLAALARITPLFVFGPRSWFKTLYQTHKGKHLCNFLETYVGVFAKKICFHSFS